MLPLTQFGPNQSPLVAYHLHQATVSIGGSVPILRQPSLLPIDRFHLAGPVQRSSPFTGFLFATPCEAGDITQVRMLPLIH